MLTLSGNDIRVFRPVQWKNFIPLIGLLILIVVGIKMGMSPAILIIPIPIFALTIWYCMTDNIHNQLIVHEYGIEYRCGNARIITRWENLKAIAYIEGQGAVLTCHVQEQVIGNHLDEMLLEKYLKHGFIPLSPIVDVPLKTSPVLHTLSIDKKNFMKTPLGRELLHYAPDLFTEPTGESLVTSNGNSRLRRRARRHNAQVKNEWQSYSGLDDLKQGKRI